MSGLKELFGHLPCYKDVVNATISNEIALITGNTGTGKSFLARRLHALGPRAKEKFVAVSPASLATGLFESELFGHSKGAFTGAYEKRIGLLEFANKGTVCLEDVTELPLDGQAKLLQFFDDSAIRRIGSNDKIGLDVRIIATTNRNIRAFIQKGLFREDLYYRLNEGFLINLPDINELPFEFFKDRLIEKIHMAREKHKMPVVTLEVDDNILSILRGGLQGNFRGINKIATWIAVNNKSTIDSSVLPNQPNNRAVEDFSLQSAIDKTARECIVATLTAFNGNEVKTALSLGIARNTLRTYMQKLSIEKGHLKAKVKHLKELV